MNRLLFISCLMVATSTVRAQLGQDSDASRSLWGAPKSGQLDEQGCGILSYQFQGTLVQLDFYSNQVHSAIYQRASFSDELVASFLKLNQGASQWHAWTPPGVPVSDLKISMWLRMDEGASAELDGGTLSIKGVPITSAPSVKAVEPVPTERQDSHAESTTRRDAPAVSTATETRTPMQRGKVQRPQILPSAGDSMPSVVTLLGEPKGIMESGDRQIMIYDWGNIWISEGSVEAVN